MKLIGRNVTSEFFLPFFAWRLKLFRAYIDTCYVANSHVANDQVYIFLQDGIWGIVLEAVCGYSDSDCGCVPLPGSP